jgi:long-chain acyl-CoA synthetase
VPGSVWVFDVDGTLIDSLTGTSLRPGTAELLTELRSTGCRTVLWSAGGARYARDRAVEHGIADLCDGFADKAARDGEGRFIAAFLDDVGAAVFVDDRPEDVPVGAHVVALHPYIAHNPHDRGFARAGLTAA